MRHSLLDLLACPVCGAYPLARQSLEQTPNDLLEALLTCRQCTRWYALRNGIPDLVRDGLRDTQADTEFLERHRALLPEEIVERGVPCNVRHRSVERTEQDARILGEGDYWGQFMAAYWDVGDRSIFDIRMSGTHPAFYGQGVLERDDRDVGRLTGLWPDHLSRVVFGWMDDRKGARVLDVGCGGGQYGLEAARRGLEVVGIDPSRGALELARRHAQETHAAIDYVRADPAQPPFRSQSFDAWIAKDSLHHIPELAAVLDRLDSLLRDGGLVAVYEHAGHSPWKRRILRTLQRRLIPRIQKRYGQGKVPDILLRESPNEGAGLAPLDQELHRRYQRLQERRELFLYFEGAELFYFASGKRRWVGHAAGTILAAIEALLLALGEPTEYLTFVGRKGRTANTAHP